MQGYNHVAGGLVFTGIFASFHDVNVFSSEGTITAAVVASVLPDIDHTRSLIGRAAYPVASWLQKRFGHRTITHSLFFLLGCVGLLLLAANVAPARSYAVVCSYALLSHLLFDMCTKQGVPLLYPFSKRPFVLPANPAFRLSTQDHRSEAIVFVVFMACGFFCQPLMAKGFWTTYNEAFATWEHVEREAKRSGTSARHDLLRVTWTDQAKRHHSGYYLRSEGATMIVLTESGFNLPKSTETRLTSFQHSGITATEHQHLLTNVPLDSLNHLLTSYCLRVQIQSATDLTYFDGPIMKAGKSIDLAYKKNLLISQPPHDDTDIHNKIKLLGIDRETGRSQYERNLLEYRTELQKVRMLEMLLQQLADEYPRSSDYRKGEIIRQRKEIEQRLSTARQSKPLPPIAPNFRRFDIETDLLRKQLRHSTAISANVITIQVAGLRRQK
jgi:inner membrane protein